MHERWSFPSNLCHHDPTASTPLIQDRRQVPYSFNEMSKDIFLDSVHVGGPNNKDDPSEADTDVESSCAVEGPPDPFHPDHIHPVQSMSDDGTSSVNDFVPPQVLN